MIRRRPGPAFVLDDPRPTWGPLGALWCLLRHRRRWWAPMQIAPGWTHYRCGMCGRWW